MVSTEFLRRSGIPVVHIERGGDITYHGPGQVVLYPIVDLREQGRDVVLTTIDSAGHQWPGSVARTGPLARLLPADPPSTALDATSALWDFFRIHPAPR